MSMKNNKKIIAIIKKNRFDKSMKDIRAYIEMYIPCNYIYIGINRNVYIV